MELCVRPARCLQGRIGVPGDKSITHRALILGALAEGTTRIKGFLAGADCLATLACLQQLGVETKFVTDNEIIIAGRGKAGFLAPEKVLDAQNSGTTMRLLLGVLASQPFTATLTGDKSLQNRPMGRVTEPLQLMGAKIEGPDGGKLAPLTVTGGQLHGITHHSPVASAQVKSAVLLAGLSAQGTTRIVEPALSRDHTERMLHTFGVQLEREDSMVSITGKQTPKACAVQIPGDISSAAFLLVAGLLVREGSITLTGVGINPTRTGILEVLINAGGDILLKNQREYNGEPVADLVVSRSSLQAFAIGGSLIPRLIDEIPILAVAATQAVGTTVIENAGELKVKESNRLQAIVKGLQDLGGQVEETADGLIIYGPTPLTGTVLESYGDHRMAMAWAVAGLLAQGETVIKGAQFIDVSYPGFANSLAALGADIVLND
ncbi:MAG: 3-phosphoshikimate 1-carboxyvinyltransferase [bacterium]